MNRMIWMLMLPLLCLSATTALAGEVEGGASLGVYDKYLWRGIDLSDSTPVIQGSAEISAHGFTLGVWGNAQLGTDGAYDGGKVNEVDLTLEYSFDAGELLSMTVGNVVYIVKDIPDTSEAYLGATINTTLSPTFTVYWDWDQAEENGLYYTAAVSHTYEPCDHTVINFGALIGYNDNSDYSVYYYDAKTDEDKSYSGWHNYELTASVDMTLSENLTLTPSLLYSSPISDEAKKAIDSEWLAALNLTYNFGF